MFDGFVQILVAPSFIITATHVEPRATSEGALFEKLLPDCRDDGKSRRGLTVAPSPQAIAPPAVHLQQLKFYKDQIIELISNQ